MDATRKLPPLEVLKEAFDLDVETGNLIRKKTYRQHKAGQVCGSRMSDGHLLVGVCREKYLAHRIVYYMHTGEDPAGFLVDHENGVPDDNRPSNLRKASRQENNRHKVGLSKVNSSGYRNVSWDSHFQRWKVSIPVGKKRIQRKFKAIEEAAACAAELRREYYGEFAGVNT